MKKDAKDTRYEITEQDLRDTFELLCQTNDPDAITVAMLIKKAGIARSTFYQHYEDMPAMINVMEDYYVKAIRSMMDSFDSVGDEEICHHFFLTLCSYVSSSMFLRRMFISMKSMSIIQKCLSMFHEYTSSRLSGVSEQSRQKVSYAVSYSIGGTVGILHRWCLNSCSDPEETVADMATASFLYGMMPYLYDNRIQSDIIQ